MCTQRQNYSHVCGTDASRNCLRSAGRKVCNGNWYTYPVEKCELERMSKMTKKGLKKYIDSWKQLKVKSWVKCEHEQKKKI